MDDSWVPHWRLTRAWWECWHCSEPITVDLAKGEAKLCSDGRDILLEAFGIRDSFGSCS